MAPALLQIRDLRVRFAARQRSFLALSGAELELHAGEALGLVGESGCGKTTLALSVLGLLPLGASVEAGSIALDGVELTRLSERELRTVRGRRVAFVPQDPSTALNPVLPVGEQIAEAARLHRGLDRALGWEWAVQVLQAVAMPAPLAAARSLPHQLSGGMRQRALLAVALAASPALLIADEPTTAVDATLQLQLLELLDQLRASRAMALLMISHDLGAVARHCQSLAVMYAGRVVERGPTARLLESPAHPYTAALLAARPPLRPTGARRLRDIPGTVPDPCSPAPGCAFSPRCPQARPECDRRPPAAAQLSAHHRVECLFPLEPRAAEEAG